MMCLSKFQIFANLEPLVFRTLQFTFCATGRNQMQRRRDSNQDGTVCQDLVSTTEFPRWPPQGAPRKSQKKSTGALDFSTLCRARERR